MCVILQIQRYKQVDLNEFEGGGAAGGIGSVLIGLLNAKMVPGIELLLSYSKMEEDVKDCTFVITGEGQSDAQTAYGKVPMGILKMAQKYLLETYMMEGNDIFEDEDEKYFDMIRTILD